MICCDFPYIYLFMYCCWTVKIFYELGHSKHQTLLIHCTFLKEPSIYFHSEYNICLYSVNLFFSYFRLAFHFKIVKQLNYYLAMYITERLSPDPLFWANRTLASFEGSVVPRGNQNRSRGSCCAPMKVCQILLKLDEQTTIEFDQKDFGAKRVFPSYHE